MSADNPAAMGMYQLMEPMYAGIIREVAEPAEADAAIADMRVQFERLVPTLAYADNPRHPMASAVNACAVALAAYLALRERGVDAHELGRAIHASYAGLTLPDEPLSQVLVDSAAASQRDAGKGEFVYDVTGSAGDTEWEMNIRSCGICAMFAPHDAMEFVPYMCALDDLFSDKTGQGLQRTGTIALGATHCDFRYNTGGEPLRLAAQYPEQIQLTAKPG